MLLGIYSIVTLSNTNKSLTFNRKLSVFSYYFFLNWLLVKWNNIKSLLVFIWNSFLYEIFLLIRIFLMNNFFYIDQGSKLRFAIFFTIKFLGILVYKRCENLKNNWSISTTLSFLIPLISNLHSMKFLYTKLRRGKFWISLPIKAYCLNLFKRSYSPNIP